ncbi:MAG: MotA/TolQ/ExbB proton channel family protein [Thermodesulfobacteriota bacterium]|nr:MotA/TolQ/ExbB proton channel family protein [Thermodesulfobacteriota bacterium]
MFISLIIKGGPIMIPIILGSIIALAIILERFWTLWRIRLNIPQFAQEIFLYLERGQFQKALERCAKVRHPIADVFKIGINHRYLKREEMEMMMEREGDEQVQYLERYLGALIIIIGVEPMMGFLGTIIGLINAFMTWEQLGTNITVNALAAGIYQAMITTAAGLSVAIPAFIIYHLIMGKIKSHAQEMTYYGNELVDILAKMEEGGGR